MTSKQILIISPEFWRWQYVSKHHYAITLADLGYHVYFLNPPQMALKNIEVIDTEYKNLHEIQAPLVTKGLRFYPKILRKHLQKKWLVKLEKLIGNTFSTIWLFENSRFYDMSFADDKLKIYHQVDVQQDLHIKEAASSADICFCVTDYIKKGILSYNKNTHKIPHGINLKNSKMALTDEQKLRFDKDKINVAYVGNLDISDINEKIFYKLVQSYPDVRFHFIGDYSSSGTLYLLCKAFDNITWWNRVESSLIPSILENIDINLVIYRVENSYDRLANANSHKILEYLQSGKVTVATYTDEYKDNRHLLEMVDDSNDYLDTFKMVINNLVKYNSIEKQQERIKFSESNSYDKQLKKIITKLDKNNLNL